MRILLTLFFFSFIGFLNAQQLQRVKTIGLGLGPYFQDFTEFNGLMYFSADDGVNGYELWQSDGTTTGTVLLKDIYLGLGDSRPGGFTAFNGKLYFNADDGIHGKELWVTDGTTAGTVMVADIQSGVAGSSPGIFAVAGGKLFFAATQSVSVAMPGNELWVTDGTAGGTQMVKDINPTSHSLPTELTAYNGKIYFNATDGTNGNELWVSDGTSLGTVMVKDINAYTNTGSNPGGFVHFNSKLYFRANDGPNGISLWQTDGTNSGTKIDSSSFAFNVPFFITSMNGALFFTASDTASNANLFKLDSATNTLTKVINAIPLSLTGVNTLVPQPQRNRLFFRGQTNMFGSELWVTDNSISAGARMVKDINTFANGAPEAMVFKDSTLFFIGTDSTYFKHVWKTDGSVTGTIKLTDTSALSTSPVTGVRQLFPYKGSIYFSARGANNTAEIWKYGVADPFDPTAVLSYRKDIRFIIYPNPSNKNIIIETNENIRAASIIDLSGKTIRRYPSYRRELDISFLVNGLYFLQIETDKGIGMEPLVKRD